MTRLRKGLELYRSKWADKIICLEGVKLDKIDKSISEVMKETLLLDGVPPEDIIVQDEATDTYHDITWLPLRLNKKFNFDNAIFITSSFHTYRVKKILEKKKIDAIVVSADPYELYPNSCIARLDLFRMFLREYLMICYFEIKGWI